jgi:peptidoglycan/LPS O-acetylase OafA/YrhL
VKYRREIDGLRALAVVPVILFHAGFETFSGGFVGVDVFFVISGYLITTIILTELEQDNFSIVNFYERRARRILPALFLVILVCIPFAWFWLLPNAMKDFSQSLVAVSVFASNILFWRESGYFDGAAELKPLLHTWSLAVEEQYYLIFPLFLMLTWRLGKRWILVLLVAVFVASFATAQWASIAKPATAFYLLPTRGWELLIGAFAAFYLSKPNRTEFGRSLGEVVGWLGLALILYAVFAYSKTTPFPGVYALAPTVGTVLIILFATQQTTIGQFVGNKAFVGVGLISYSAYLWHQPLFAFARNFTFNQMHLLLSLFLIALTFVLSALTMKYVETPFRKVNVVSKKSVFLFSILGTAFFIVVGSIGILKDGFPGKFLVLSSAIDDWNHPGSLKKTNINGYYKFDSNKPINVLFFGDSHAEQFAPLAKDIGSKGLNAAFLSGGGCPPIPNLISDARLHCADLFDRLNQILSIEKNIKEIIVAGCFNCYFLNNSELSQNNIDVNSFYFLDDSKKLYFNKGQGKSEALQSFKSFLQQLSVKAKVIVIGDNPNNSLFNPSTILAHRLRGDSMFFKSSFPNFSSEAFEVLNEQLTLDQSIKDLVDLSTDSSFLSLINIVCPNSKCNALDENENPLYKDSNHMRPGFVKKTIAPHILKLLE